MGVLQGNPVGLQITLSLKKKYYFLIVKCISYCLMLLSSSVQLLISLHSRQQQKYCEVKYSLQQQQLHLLQSQSITCTVVVGLFTRSAVVVYYTHCNSRVLHTLLWQYTFIVLAVIVRYYTSCGSSVLILLQSQCITRIVIVRHYMQCSSSILHSL